jgi:hypothetical protein
MSEKKNKIKRKVILVKNQRELNNKLIKLEQHLKDHYNDRCAQYIYTSLRVFYGTL